MPLNMRVDRNSLERMYKSFVQPCMGYGWLYCNAFPLFESWLLHVDSGVALLTLAHGMSTALR